MKAVVLKKIKFKSDLIKKFVKKGLSPLQYYEGIIKADWIWNNFVQAKKSRRFGIVL